MPERTQTAGPPVASLTDRQRMILALLAQGRNRDEAARELYISLNTVKNHLEDAYVRLNVTSLTAAVFKAVRVGLLTPCPICGRDTGGRDA